MAERTTLQIRIDPQRKRRWKDFADTDPEWRSLTDLIVTSVERQLDDPAPTATANVDLSELHDRIDLISDQLDDIEDIADETRYHVVDSEDNYTEIASRVLDLVPLINEDERDSLLQMVPETPAAETTYEEDISTAERTGSVTHFVSALEMEGYSATNIKAAVEQLAEDSTTVKLAYAKPQAEQDMRVWRVDE